MPKSDSISMSVIRRLPRYYRFLCELDDRSVERISSTELSKIMHSTASQVRQDLNCFGGFGQQGYGYTVKGLRDEIKKILGLNKGYKAVMIGAGNFGAAIVNYLVFNKLGFELAGCFDCDKEKLGKQLGGLTIMDDSLLDSFCKENEIEAAFLCIPKESVESILDKLYGLGIKCYWNFSHYDLSSKYSDVVVENVHLSDSLMTLCYRMNNSK